MGWGWGQRPSIPRRNGDLEKKESLIAGTRAYSQALSLSQPPLGAHRVRQVPPIPHDGRKAKSPAALTESAGIKSDLGILETHVFRDHQSWKECQRPPLPS